MSWLPAGHRAPWSVARRGAGTLPTGWRATMWFGVTTVMLRGMKALPRWAAWSPAAAERPWTVGLEEEVMLVDPETLAPAGVSGEVLAALPAKLRGHVFQETHACALELVTG